MYRHILVPTDGSTQSKQAAEEAIRLVEAHDARLTILTVVQEIDTGSLDSLGTDGVEQALKDAERQKGEERINETLAAIESPTVGIETEIVTGTPHRAICDYVDSAGIDLVILGTIGHDSLASYILGSTTERVTQLCEVPVLVV